MTKTLVSLMGVAVVATMVILAGCGDGPGKKPADEDHAAALAGDWSMDLPGTQMIANPAPPPDELEVTTSIAVKVTSGDEANMGTLAITVTQSLVATMTALPSVAVSGDIAVAEAEMTVTNIMVEPADQVPPQAAPLLEVPQTFTYELADDGSMLTVGVPSLLAAALSLPATLMLTKQMASS